MPVLVPLTFIGKWLMSPEGVALLGSVAAWLLRRDSLKGKRAKLIAERAGIVFDGMEQWAAYRRSKGETVTGSQKLDAYLGYVEDAVKAVGGGGPLTVAEKAALAADAAVRSWLAKAPPKAAKK